MLLCLAVCTLLFLTSFLYRITSPSLTSPFSVLHVRNSLACFAHVCQYPLIFSFLKTPPVCWRHTTFPLFSSTWIWLLWHSSTEALQTSSWVTDWGCWHRWADERFGDPPQGGSGSLQWAETGMEDPKRTLWQCTAPVCVLCSGSALLGDLLGVISSREWECLSYWFIQWLSFAYSLSHSILLYVDECRLLWFSCQYLPPFSIWLHLVVLVMRKRG